MKPRVTTPDGNAISDFEYVAFSEQVKSQSVYAIYGLTDREWTKLAKLFARSGVTKYRRLPQDDCVLFTGPHERLAEIATHYILEAPPDKLTGLAQK